MEPIFYDTETCGLHGPIVLLQYAKGLKGDVELVSVWRRSVGEVIEILESIVKHPGGVVGFNMVFDHFHICQMLSVLYLLDDYSAVLEDCIEEYALKESEGRFGPCIKPVKACDLMLHARKGPYQAVMDRGDIRIRRVPTALAWPLAEELEQRVKLKRIFFGRKKSFDKAWQVYDIETVEGKIDKDFKDVVLKFAATSALKAIATDALGLEPDTVLKYSDIELTEYPVEYGYAPFATAVGRPYDWRGAWPEIIHRHIAHWTWYDRAREYAKLDVVYLQKLYEYFGSPKLGDTDSELACMVAAVRWRGFAANIPGLIKLRDAASLKNRKILSLEEGRKIPFLDMTEDGKGYYFQIPTSPRAARTYLEQVLSPTERLVMEGSTKKPVLEKMQRWRECTKCGNFTTEGGETCGQLVNPGPEYADGFTPKSNEICGALLIVPEAAKRAKEILEARQCDYEVDFYNKIILAGRFHASSSVIGSLSGRMAGGGSAKGIEKGGSAKGDGLNPLGVKRTKEVRGEFPLADMGLVLCGGDFSAFEVTLAIALYGDKQLSDDVASGKKIHALFGQFLFPKATYEQICKSAGTSNDMYEKSKRGFFSTLYGGTAETINSRVGISLEDAIVALQMFAQHYPQVGVYQSTVNAKCCSMRQPNGIGTKVEWHEPVEYAESMFGFRRYYTLENMITKALFALASDPPKDWRNAKIKVTRRDRVQSAFGATQSALYGAAFAIQAANMRSFKNHEIQASGAEITKEVQRKIWDIQPAGISPWLVQPLNVHDEIQCPTHPSVVQQVSDTVRSAVEAFRTKVPLIKMDWQSNLQTWADKS